MKKISILLFSGMVLFAVSCRKERLVSLSQHDKPNLSAVSSQTLLGQADLSQQMMSLSVSPYVLTGSVFNGGTGFNTTEVINSYELAGTLSTAHVALADFGWLTATEKNFFLSGAAFAVAPVGSSTAFYQAADPTMGYMMQQYTGGGAVSMARTAAEGAVGLFSDNVVASQGSYISASALVTSVPGWEIYDAVTRVGFVILLVNDRFGIVVDGTELPDLNTLKHIAASFDFAKLTSFGQ